AVAPLFTGVDWRKAESAGPGEAAKSQTDGAVWRGYAPGAHGALPVFFCRRFACERQSGIRQAVRPFQARGRTMAEAGGKIEEARKGFEIRQAAEAIAYLPGALEGAGR